MKTPLLLLTLMLTGSLAAQNPMPAAQNPMPAAQHPMPAASNPLLDAPKDGHTAVRLWAGDAPGAQGSEAGDIPTLTMYLPAVNPTHTAVVVVPGGGYSILALNHEGAQIGDWLADHGIAAFVLKYRLGPKYHYPIQLDDAQRALRTVRAQAASYGVDVNHVGMWGFSAGGHLTALAGTHFDSGNASAPDAIDRQSSRPDFLVLAYPVITMAEPVTHAGSLKMLLGDAPSAELIRSVSTELQVTDKTPPTFLFATTDDNAVPVKNSVLFYEALIDHKVSAEMHLFQHGRHGLGMAQDQAALKVWPSLLLTWLEENGWAK